MGVATQIGLFVLPAASAKVDKNIGNVTSVSVFVAKPLQYFMNVV